MNLAKVREGLGGYAEGGPVAQLALQFAACEGFEEASAREVAKAAGIGIASIIINSENPILTPEIAAILAMLAVARSLHVALFTESPEASQRFLEIFTAMVEAVRPELDAASARASEAAQAAQ